MGEDSSSLINPRRPRDPGLSQGLRWAVWLFFVAGCAAGLGRYRVDNALDQWMPEYRGEGLTKSYLIVGGPSSELDADALAMKLNRSKHVAACISSGSLRRGASVQQIDPVGLVESRSGDYVGVIVFAAIGVDDAAFVNEVERISKNAAHASAKHIALGGSAVFHEALNQFSQARLPQISAIILTLIVLLLWWILSDFWNAVRAAIAITTSQVALLGMIAWHDYAVDMTVSMIPPLMMALGASFAAHRATRVNVTRTLFLCMGTTAIGIGSFMAADVKPIRMFAMWGVVGLVLVWFAVVLLVRPASDEGESRNPQCEWLRVIRVGMDRVRHRHRKFTMAVAFTTVSLSIASFTLLRSESDPLNYFPKNAQIVQDHALLNQNLTGMLPFQVTVSGDADPTEMLSATPGVRRVIPMRLFDPASHNAFWCLADQGSLPEIRSAQADWRAWAESHAVTIRWHGVAAQLAHMTKTVQQTALSSLPVMVIMVALVLGWISKRPRDVLAGTLANLFPLSSIILLLVVTDWPIGLPSLMIGAIVIGVAVDDTIHIVHARTKLANYSDVYRDCWRPVVGSSLLSCACLVIFALSPFRPTMQFGLLLAFAVAVALLSDLLLLPVLAERKSVEANPTGQCPDIAANTSQSPDGPGHHTANM